MTLPPDIQNYRKFQLALHPRVPDEIAKRWSTRVIPDGLHDLGEQGAEAYLLRFGKGISEQKVVYFAIKAEREKCYAMADGFWKKAYALHLENPIPKARKVRTSKKEKQAVEPILDVKAPVTTGNTSSPTGVVIGHDTKTPPLNGEDRHSVQEWWHEILRIHGKYSCCAFILVLPTDNEAIKYLTEFGRELDLLSRKNCLVIALSDIQATSYGFDENKWKEAINEQISNGQSLEIAKLFEIPFTEFPCMVIFEDIRSAEHLVVSLRKMEVGEISQKMRSVFSIIQSATGNKVNPLIELRRLAKKEELQRAGQSVIGELRRLAGKSFETAIEVVVQAIAKTVHTA